MAAKAKELGFSAQELKGMTTPTKDVWFQNVPDPKNPGQTLQGPHSTGTGSMPFCVELDNLKDTDAPIHQPAAMLVAAD